MPKPFKKIAITGRSGTTGVRETCEALFNYLQTQGLEIILEKDTAKFFTKNNLPVLARNKLKSAADLLIVVGGDGSLLNIAPSAAEQNLPVLGINRGHLGFLTDINPNKLEAIGSILAGAYSEEKRFLLEVTIDKDGEVLHQETILNDLVLTAGVSTKLIEFTLKIDSDYVCDYRADGLIVATPTGSTAYALAGGGPILHPSLQVLGLVPMFPQNLSSRPIVVSCKSQIDLLISRRSPVPLCLSHDGREHIEAPSGATVTIREAKEHLCLIHPEDYNYFATLRSKLSWEQ